MIRIIKASVKSHLPEIVFDKIVWARKYILSLYYLGRHFKCPICHGNFRVFLPYGKAQRINARCPRCGSLERQRLYWLYLKDKTNFFKSKLRVLHFAPMFYLQRFYKRLPNLDYISTDLNDTSAMINMDITDIKFEDNTFDCILCVLVLEHGSDDKKAMKELFRVLKPQGWAIIQVPIKFGKTFENNTIRTPEERLKYFGQEDHVRIYGMDYKERLQDAGFSVKIDPYLDNLDQNIIDRYKLVPENEPKEKIYFCTITIK